MGMSVEDGAKDATHPVIAAYERDGDGKVKMFSYPKQMLVDFVCRLSVA
jgi:hypothetical protein